MEKIATVTGFNAKYMKGNFHIVAGEYHNAHGPNRIALRAIALSGKPIATVTTNIDTPESGKFHRNEFFIKNWSENEGALEELVRLGVVEDTGKRITTGFVEAAVCTWKGNDNG